MYLEYFGLAERPFSIAPDPHYLYMSTRHKEAMAHLSYGLSQGGCFIVLSGEVGTGKTTLCRNLLEDLPDDVEVALILNANINERELLQTVCDELKIDYREQDTQKQLLDQINAHLLAEFAENRQTVLIIDEAQLLSRDVLEQVRLLTNLETSKSKLLQIILIGQPELNDLLSRNDLRQLAQRVTARYHLGSLEPSEIEDYVNFRLSVAGCRKPLFTKQALGQLYRSTEGIPRRINVLADHALLSAYAKNAAIVDAKSVRLATNEVFVKPERQIRGWASQRVWLLSISIVLLVNVLMWWWFASESEAERAASGLGSGQVTLDFASQEPIRENSLSGQVEEFDSTKRQPLGEADDEPSEADAALTTIIRPAGITPGTVIIADEPLDESEIFSRPSSPIEVAPVKSYQYDATSELGRVLDGSADLTGRIAAFRALAAAWDVDLPAQMIQPACSILSKEGVECLTITTWSQLQRYNRPAILVLDQNNRLHRVIVFKLEDGSAQLLVGQNVLSVSQDELKSRWTNNGITFWRPSFAGSEFLQQGDESAQLPKVRDLLNQAFSKIGMATLGESSLTVFDLSLAQAVFSLQTKYSLVADSKIGSETYLLINEVLSAEDRPVLRQRVQ